MRILSWNVNGIRAVWRKGLPDWLIEESPDIFCAQETKAQPEQLAHVIQEPHGYHDYWHSGERRGYSGVLTMCKVEALSYTTNFDVGILGTEGRVVMTEHHGFLLFNIYFPNGRSGDERLKYKMDFYEAFLGYADSLQKAGNHLVVCGDFNTAHHPIDLARPNENETISGFLPIERKWMDQFEAHGFVDTFRLFSQEPRQYTWWDMKSRARDRNIGWRIDYFYVSSALVPAVKDAVIMPGVMGSDHCPIGIELDLPG